jgi:uncharacterized damage-inducible protein DinB
MASGLQITDNWRRLNQTIIDLVDYIPEGKINWSPRPELHNFKGILIHISSARNNWMGGCVQDGEASPDVLQEGQTVDGLLRHLELSWQRVERFLSDQSKLDATYEGVWAYGNEPYSHTGHWVAYHLLEHDVHHRADIFHYLALLEVEHPDVSTP